MTITPIRASELSTLLELHASDLPLPGIPQTVRMSPDLARELLDLHERSGFQNRKTSRAQVNRLKADISAGRWRLTPQAVGLATNGAIVDGKHRVTAVSEGTETIDMLVWSNVPIELFTKMDSVVRARSGSDWVNILGISETHQSQVSSGYRLLAAYETSTSVSKNALTPDELIEIHTRFPGLVEHITEAKRLQKATKMPDSTAAVATYLIKECMPDLDVRVFMEGVCDGVGLTTDDPRWHLRRWMEKHQADKRTKAGRSLMDPTETLRVTLLAAIDWRNGERHARHRINSRAMPLLLPSQNTALIAS